MSDDLVTRPPDYYQPGSVVEYAPGYRIFANDGLYLEPKYDDAYLETLRRKTLTDPSWAFQHQSLMAAAGYMSKDDVGALWTTDLTGDYAKALSDANQNYMSIDDWLRYRAGMASAAASSRGSRGGGPSTSTSTNRSVRLTSRASAQAILKQTLAQELGREPTAAEVTRFVKSLNKEERANPQVTTTTSRSDGKGNSSSSSTTKESSVDPMSEGEEFAETASPQEARMFQHGQLYDVISRMAGF